MLVESFFACSLQFQCLTQNDHYDYSLWQEPMTCLRIVTIFAIFQNFLIFRMLAAFSSRILRRTTLILFSFSSRFGTEYINVFVESFLVLNFFYFLLLAPREAILIPFCHIVQIGYFCHLSKSCSLQLLPVFFRVILCTESLLFGCRVVFRILLLSEIQPHNWPFFSILPYHSLWLFLPFSLILFSFFFLFWLFFVKSTIMWLLIF